MILTNKVFGREDGKQSQLKDSKPETVWVES